MKQNGNANRWTIGALIGLMASLISIVVFITGKNSLPEIFDTQPPSSRVTPNYFYPTSVPDSTINLTGQWSGQHSVLFYNGSRGIYTDSVSLAQTGSKLTGTMVSGCSACYALNGYAYDTWGTIKLVGTIDRDGTVTFTGTLVESFPPNTWRACNGTTTLYYDRDRDTLRGSPSDPYCDVEYNLSR